MDGYADNVLKIMKHMDKKVVTMETLLNKYPKIHTVGSPETSGIFNEVVVCQSKIDGANLRCRYIAEEDKLIFGSRNQMLDNPNPNEWKAIRSYRKAFELFKNKFIPNVVYFSESMQKHTISYENIPDTIGYDVFDVERQEFYNWKTAKVAFENIGIPFINVHFEKHGRDVTIDELKTLIKKSPYKDSGDEGIVLKCYNKKNIFGRPLWGKIVDELFKEDNKKVFKEIIPTSTNDDYEIIDRYLTEARFKKAILALKENGNVIDMSLIPKLFKYLGDDILSENILYISGEWKNLNFKTFYNLIARRCAEMLKEYLLNEAHNQPNSV